jgi:signal transduction histidine kinase
MRPALVTILPMLAAAVLVMIGGERIARRDVETRTPADRERLLDLADTLRAELLRLDQLYLSHLDDLSNSYLYGKPAQAATEAAAIVGLRRMRIFRKNGNDIQISPPFTTERFPEIEIEKRKRPLDPSTAVILEAELLEKMLPMSKFWRSTSDPSFRIYCNQPEPGILIVLIIELSSVREATTGHLTKWLPAPLTPLLEAGERVDIDSPLGSAVASIGPPRHGPAALVLPARTLFGDWQIRAWDSLVLSRSHNTSTLTAASAVALLLAGSGVLLFSQHKRALKLAAERVSFVNRVSHELGTPLTNLSLNLDLATEALTDRPKDARHRLGLVAEEIERLSRLVANVLTFSRRERDTLEIKPVSCIPGETIRRTLESFRPALKRRGIQIEANISSNENAVLDADALSQITGNLLSNVEKYAVEGKWLHIESQLQDGFLVLEIHDRGPGIPTAARQRIFTPFERVLNTTNEGASGTGLGLSIGRDLAQRMGGTLELLDSSEGAAFRLRIPAPSPQAIDSHATLT